jgi:hypothetical protein
MSKIDAALVGRIVNTHHEGGVTKHKLHNPKHDQEDWIRLSLPSSVANPPSLSLSELMGSPLIGELGRNVNSERGKIEKLMLVPYDVESRS